MGTRLDKKLRGLMIPDPRLCRENLRASGGTGLDSSFTEAGPRPGTSVPANARSELLPQISNGQAVDLELQITSSGNPAIEGGAAVAVRQVGLAQNRWRGWDDPNVFQTLHAINYTTDTGAAPFGAVVRATDQKLFVAYGPGVIQIREWSGTSFSGAGQILGTGAANAVDLVALPSGRLVAFVAGLTGSTDSFFSDDDGATWLPLATDILGGLTGTSIQKIRATLVNDLILLVFESIDGSPIIVQYASRDLGVSAQLVESIALFGTDIQTMLFPSGKIGIVYLANGTNDNEFRVIGNPFDSFSGAPAVTILGAGSGTLGMCGHVDPDGVAFAFDAGLGTIQNTYRSIDEGLTWQRYRMGPMNMVTTAAGPTKLSSYAVQGGVALLHHHTAAADTHDQSLWVAWLGFWTTIEMGEQPETGLIGHIGWGFDVGAAPGLQKSWVPYELPDLVGWSLFGTGTHTLVVGSLEIVTTAQSRSFFLDFGTRDTVIHKQTVQCMSGGDLNSTVVGFRVRAANGAQERQIEVNFTTSPTQTEFRFIDVSDGAVLATHVFLFTQAIIQVMVQVVRSTGAFKTFYQLVGDGPGTTWSPGPAGTLSLAGAPSATNRIIWGNRISGTATGRYRSLFYKADNTAAFAARLADDVSLMTGKSLAGLPFPIGGIPQVSTAFTHIALRGGVAALAAQHTIAAAHDFSVDNLFAPLSPSPSETWRSTTDRNTSVHFTFERPAVTTRIGQSWILAVYIANQNFKLANIEVDVSGTGTWVQIGQWDASVGFKALLYEVNGDTLRPNKATTPTAGRYMHRAELVRGIAQPSSGNAQRIVRNTSGWWTQGTTVDPVIELEDTAGGFPLQPLDIVVSGGVLFIPLDGAIADFVRGIRVVIPNQAAGQPVLPNEDYFEAGLMMIGAITPFGQQWSRGYSQDYRPNVTSVRSPFGTERVRQEGPNRGRWTMGWPDGVKLNNLRGEATLDGSTPTAPNYLGPAGKPPAIVDQDVWTLLTGLLDEVKGGELPVVAIADIVPGAAVMVTDRTLFLYGNLDGSIRFDHILGNEGEDEYGRIANITVEGNV